MRSLSLSSEDGGRECAILYFAFWQDDPSSLLFKGLYASVRRVIVSVVLKRMVARKSDLLEKGHTGDEQPPFTAHICRIFLHLSLKRQFVNDI